MEKQKSIYIQLKEACLPRITAFHDDLIKHDRRRLFENKKTNIPFIHFTRDHGTFLTSLWPRENLPGPGKIQKYLFGRVDASGMLESEKGGFENHIKNDVDHKQIVHYYNGRTLKKITIEKAEKIYAEYYFKMLNKLSKERYNHANNS